MKTTRIGTGATGWRSGATLIGPSGFGVLGSAVPSSGVSGAGFAYTSLSLPGDASKEICGSITSWPSVGTLYAYDDTSFEYTPPAGGYAYTSFDWQLYVDGVAVGSPVTVTLSVGGFIASVGDAVAAGATAGIVGTAIDVIISAAVGDAVAAGATAGIVNDPVATLNSADVAAIWAYEVEPGLSAAAAMRILLAYAAGNVTGGPSNPQFSSLDGTKVRIAGTADASGNRTRTTLDGSA